MTYLVHSLVWIMISLDLKNEDKGNQNQWKYLSMWIWKMFYWKGECNSDTRSIRDVKIVMGQVLKIQMISKLVLFAKEKEFELLYSRWETWSLNNRCNVINAMDLVRKLRVSVQHVMVRRYIHRKLKKQYT